MKHNIHKKIILVDQKNFYPTKYKGSIKGHNFCDVQASSHIDELDDNSKQKLQDEIDEVVDLLEEKAKRKKTKFLTNINCYNPNNVN